MKFFLAFKHFKLKINKNKYYLKISFSYFENKINSSINLKPFYVEIAHHI